MTSAHKGTGMLDAFGCIFKDDVVNKWSFQVFFSPYNFFSTFLLPESQAAFIFDKKK